MLTIWTEIHQKKRRRNPPQYSIYRVYPVPYSIANLPYGQSRSPLLAADSSP